MILYKIIGVHQIQQQNYVQRVVFPKYCLDNISSSSGFISRTVYPDGHAFCVSAFASVLRTRIWGKIHSKEISQREIQLKSNTLVAVHNNGLVGPCYTNNEPV